MLQDINQYINAQGVDDDVTLSSGARLPLVAIIGRPNVGKSSLFNRLLARRHAIVSDVAGTTRDRLFSEVTWQERRFLLVDTGGLETNPEGHIREMVQEQADMAVNDADVIIFMTDAIDGLGPSDQLINDQLRQTSKPIILAVNKVDNDSRELVASEFYQLGIADTVFISAFHNHGIYDLMDKVSSYLDVACQSDPLLDPEVVSDQRQRLKLSIVGRTNVGKSMLLNAILGEQRSIVSDVAGTTRDALDTELTFEGKEITVIDTAGIRRPGKVEKGIEKYSVLRSVNAVNRSDITLLVVDASELATSQDSHISGLAWDMCRGLIVVVNKWDLIPDTDRYAKRRAVRKIRELLHFMPYAPMAFISAINGDGIKQLLNAAVDLYEERQRWVPTRELQYLLAEALVDHNPPPVKGRKRERLRVTRLRQVDINPPTFLFTVNEPELVHFSYKRYLENKIRDTFGYDRTHLRLVFKKN
ncbi:MAG: ribosome biogenesis GTPase Der [Chloroflexota bacterium]|nr:ribosome biogenesis GTPase Der [Chloroflexota bacterium]